MLDRLKAAFKVKERQDFRGLYTDPPISFAEDYPAVPKPEAQLSPKILSAKWVAGDLHGEEMPDIAANLLGIGIDGPAVRRLAAETSVGCSADVADLVDRMFGEILTAFPISETQAKLILTRQFAREVVSGECNAWAAASRLRTVIWGRNAQNPDLLIISGLLDALDWDAVNKNRLPDLTSELVAVFARLGARTEEELSGTHTQAL